MMDLTNKRFGRLEVWAEAPRKAKHLRRWLCKCECGERTVVQQGNLLSGHTTSCGCYRKEVLETASKTHGHYKKGKPSRTLQAWQNMRRRCYDPTNKAFKWYGAKGVTVCDAWRYFEQFVADMGDCPPGLTLERIDTYGNYEPANCKWATWKEQQNNRRNNRRAA